MGTWDFCGAYNQSLSPEQLIYGAVTTYIHIPTSSNLLSHSGGEVGRRARRLWRNHNDYVTECMWSEISNLRLEDGARFGPRMKNGAVLSFRFSGTKYDGVCNCTSQAAGFVDRIPVIIKLHTSNSLSKASYKYDEYRPLFMAAVDHANRIHRVCGLPTARGTVCKLYPSYLPR